MSALDEVAKNYAEEAMQFAPAAGIASAVVGVALHHSVAGVSKGSVWWHLLSAKYEEYWYFLDVLKQQQLLWLAVPIVLACCGDFLFRMVAKKMLAKGIASQAISLRNMFASARLNAHWGSEKAIEIAESWYKRSERRVFVFFRLGVFFSGLFLQSLASVAFHFSLGDALFSLFILAGAVYFAWHFSLSYYGAVLPRKLIVDASMGLAEPDITSDLDGFQ